MGPGEGSPHGLLVLTHPPLVVAPLPTERNDPLDLPISPDVGVVDNFAKIILESSPPFLNKLRVLVRLAPEVCNRKRRHLILHRQCDTLSVASC